MNMMNYILKRRSTIYTLLSYWLDFTAIVAVCVTLKTSHRRSLLEKEFKVTLLNHIIFYLS